jgi:hypothetical protein
VTYVGAATVEAKFHNRGIVGSTDSLHVQIRVVQEIAVTVTIEPAPVGREAQSKVLQLVPDKPPERDGIAVNAGRHGVVRLRLPLTGVPSAGEVRSLLAQRHRALEAIIGASESP